jgi:hypothetical protein
MLLLTHLLIAAIIVQIYLPIVSTRGVYGTVIEPLPLRAIACSQLNLLIPSPGTPGEGEGGGFMNQSAFGPHPNPPPEYQGRGKKGTCDCPALPLVVVHYFLPTT